MGTPVLSPLIDDPAADPLFWPASRAGVDSAWYGHVPFAHWITAAIRPRLLVELGTHNGVSFAAFCEAVHRCSIPARCIAIDMWEGDAHAGFYGSSVRRDLAGFIAQRYPAIAEMRQASFADALPGVPDGSVDLLHVDGRHRYEDVREDYESWQPKLSARAVVLFHDICEQREDFGVHRYWAELTRTLPNFAFHHAHGLGVLLPGSAPPAAAARLCALRHTQAAETIRQRFATLGAHHVATSQLADAQTAITGLRGHAADLQTHIDKLARYTAGLEQKLQKAGSGLVQSV